MEEVPLDLGNKDNNRKREIGLGPYSLKSSDVITDLSTLRHKYALWLDPF